MSKKVVHVLGRMDAGGVEAWLMTLLRNTDKSSISHEFIVHSDKRGFYDEEIYELNSKIHYCKFSHNPLIYSFNLYKTLRNLNPDIVHSHVHNYSGLVLLVAYLSGIESRISHCHSDTRIKKKSFIRRLYSVNMKYLISKFATSMIAVSSNSAEDLYGMNWKDKENVHLIPCGIDVSKYDSSNIDVGMREALNLPKEAFVIGHVGRFEEPKNHDFLIEVFYKFREKNDQAYLVLVGDGKLRAEIESKVAELDLTPYVIFMGLRKDVPSIMLSVFDVFVFPSLWEGLGLVAVEAQLSGLRVLASESVPKEIDCGRVVFIALQIDLWIKEMLFITDGILEEKVVNFDRFSITENVRKLNNVYFS